LPDLLYPNFVYDKKRNRREISQRTRSFIALSNENFRFLDEYPKLDYYQCKELSMIINGEEINEARTFSFTPSEAKQYFIACNLKLVRNIVSDYSLKYIKVEPEDLFQMGVLGLIRAVEKWDHEREFLFSTYATWWIRQSLSREYSNTSDLIRVPIHMLEIQPKVVDYIDKYTEFFGRGPDIAEACDALEIQEYQYVNALNSIFEYQSLTDILNSDGELSVRPAVSQDSDTSNLDPESMVSETLLRQHLEQVLWGLTDREATIIIERFGLDSGVPATLDEIAKLFSLTRERIRQIESKTFSKLRHPSRTEHLKDFLDIDSSAIGHLSCENQYSDFE
jgi:RNA polymerase primary sigma factor